MKTRFRLYQRGSFKPAAKRGFFYSFDNETGKQRSLNTKDKKEALRMLASLNEAHQQPAINHQIAMGYLMARDSRCVERTWGYVLETMISQKSGSTQQRLKTVRSDKALKALWAMPLVQTQADDLFECIRNGNVSTNVFLRRLHNFAADLVWIPRPIISKRQWPKVVYGTHRAITREEHERILAREQNSERRAYYALCWCLGGSQGDIARLTTDDLDVKNKTVFFERGKTKVPVRQKFGAQVEAVLKQLPSGGPLFPYLRSVRSADRATEFKQRCKGLGIHGVTLHSYRYAWAERAKQAGIPERYAQEALGHSSKAMARAYARQADMSIPALEDYENQMQSKVIQMPAALQTEISQARATG